MLLLVSDDTWDGNICLLYAELAFLKYLEGVYGNVASDYNLKLSHITHGEIPLRSTCIDNVKWVNWGIMSLTVQLSVRKYLIKSLSELWWKRCIFHHRGVESSKRLLKLYQRTFAKFCKGPVVKAFGSKWPSGRKALESLISFSDFLPRALSSSGSYHLMVAKCIETEDSLTTTWDGLYSFIPLLLTWQMLCNHSAIFKTENIWLYTSQSIITMQWRSRLCKIKRKKGLSWSRGLQQGR